MANNVFQDTFESAMKKKTYIIIVLALLSLVAMGYFSWRFYGTLSDLEDAQVQTLTDTRSFQSTPLLASSLSIAQDNPSDISLIIDELTELQEEQETIQTYLERIRTPFSVLLRHIYLPSLNIWKDPYSGVINTKLLGSDFLESNPYTDIALIDQWTDFFKNMGSVYNEIDAIVVQDIVQEDEFFYIPIQVEFTAPTRRAFLFLLNKLSLTSDPRNIMLVNELFYHVWEEVDALQLSTEVYQQLLDDNDILIEYSDETHDVALAALIDEWMQPNSQVLDEVITDEVVERIVRRASTCDIDDSDQVCEFLFREKYRTIPRLAYAMGYQDASSEELVDFFRIIPPLLVVDTFEFEKNLDDIQGSETSYVGTVQIRVYGSSMVASEVTEIAALLGEQCYGDGAMSAERAFGTVQDTLLSQGDAITVSSSRSQNLLELQGIFQTIIDNYGSLDPYNQAIRLFEIERMMDDASLCQ